MQHHVPSRLRSWCAALASVAVIVLSASPLLAEDPPEGYYWCYYTAQDLSGEWHETRTACLLGQGCGGISGYYPGPNGPVFWLTAYCVGGPNP